MLLVLDDQDGDACYPTCQVPLKDFQGTALVALLK